MRSLIGRLLDSVLLGYALGIGLAMLLVLLGLAPPHPGPAPQSGHALTTGASAMLVIFSGAVCASVLFSLQVLRLEQQQDRHLARWGRIHETRQDRDSFY